MTITHFFMSVAIVALINPSCEILQCFFLVFFNSYSDSEISFTLKNFYILPTPHLTHLAPTAKLKPQSYQSRQKIKQKLFGKFLFSEKSQWET